MDLEFLFVELVSKFPEDLFMEGICIFFVYKQLNRHISRIHCLE